VEKVRRVAYVVVMFPCYSETFVLREIRELTRRGVEVTILSLRDFSEGDIEADARDLVPRTLYSRYLFSFALLRAHLHYLLRSPGAYLGTVATLTSELFWNPRQLIKNAGVFLKSVYFARMLHDGKIQHVHAHFANYPATSAYIISRLTGIPFTMTAHAHDIFQNQLLLATKLRLAKRLFAISGYNRDFIMRECPGVPPEKIEVLHSGLDISRVHIPRQGRGERGMILSLGRMVAIKGFDTLVRAVAILRDRIAPLRCVIVGEGPLRKELDRLIIGLGLGDVVELPGRLTDREIAGLMERCEVFVLPSRPADRGSGVMDGIPGSLMEAMALGIPVVSCPVSGIPELVAHEETGLLVPPGDERKLAEAIARLLGSEELKMRLGRAGREKVAREFDIVKTVNRLLEVFGTGGRN
jgi:glycosyltransferase involved in cell wall biosynthesis